MPVIRINDVTFADLSTLKTWFGTRTPTETIDRIVREIMEQLGIERDDEPAENLPISKDGPIYFENAPSLFFTKPLSVSISSKNLPNPRWVSILLTLIGQIGDKGIKGEKLIRELEIPARVGQYEEDGYRYHPHLGISVQGQSAPDCWKEVNRLANKWRIPVSVEFCWRDNPKAQYPGKVGLLRSGGV